MDNESRSKAIRPKAIRRLVIWYRRNSAVTTLVDTATNSASAAGNVAGSVVSSAGSVVSSAGSIARSTLQPLVFDPLRRLQAGPNELDRNDIANSKRLWVAVDGMGGDNAPGSILEGCLQAIDRLPLCIKFVGEIEKIHSAADELGISDLLNQLISAGNIELVASGPSIGMDEEATAVRKKRDASINIAMDLVKKGEALSVYSAGNSGALMAAAIFRLGRLAGIDRPAIGALFPTKDPGQPVLVLDVGANMDCKPAYLHQFALLGNIYSRDVLQVQNPRIGLLNIGEEECKGNDLSLRTFELLKEEERLDFVGNCEGRDVLSGDFDVVVCDGFTGNVLLKFLESVGSVLLDVLRAELPRGRRGKVGSAFLRNNLKRIKKRLDHAEHGGALLLGVNGICVIGHGSSKALSVVSALRIAHSAASHGVMDDLAALQPPQP
ncbi:MULTISPECIES: phosphate acyltransferase PlsX [Prochlorococcus]|uniref:Phosphate acyltransferase n=1 Tax=Prochlorococcus marinus (strain SARG / CCMP1375 / SS120) TaxID=167539 RepID=PLSX_PROMA|nr:MULTISPECIES: phosphate acyltransferase PlsX [Prochlorococcus]Q7VE56.1 RecName: Full=Phosphate acyltransferase; AltName: Full=Acyl-ACP phosphotransacylase; AltName: Full=Acyl-[acyl-carrier-protein]--phosphate acyltransferase; AltName: Full=Phosphate-acyl-ACP acyltransferase [Prochlorococcus marinus subsp. marinus str. CCMP1375]AAP99203.1 Fatty acid/phospholipid biosynthesis enzyme [Prochlorococcus marinus subsp. marinus str. CCMP1375]KGG11529.1 Phosphate:acyl-ACP acyltransferase PlsX [Prochlo